MTLSLPYASPLQPKSPSKLLLRQECLTFPKSSPHKPQPPPFKPPPSKPSPAMPPHPLLPTPTTRAPRHLLRLTVSQSANPQTPPSPATTTTPAPPHIRCSFRQATRSRLPPLPLGRLVREPVWLHTQSQHRIIAPLYRRCIATAAARPGAAEPAARQQQQEQEQEQAAQLSMEKFHTLADAYIDTLVMRLEELQEEEGREDVDVEYSVCSLPHLFFPPQPPGRTPTNAAPSLGQKKQRPAS